MLSGETLARRVAELMLDRKALDVVIIDVGKLTSYADYLVIASGTSERHVQGIVHWVQESLKKESVHALGCEGFREGQWALLDLGATLVHVFHEYTRGIYDLEGLWQKAKKIVPPQPTQRLAEPLDHAM